MPVPSLPDFVIALSNYNGQTGVNVVLPSFGSFVLPVVYIQDDTHYMQIVGSSDRSMVFIYSEEVGDYILGGAPTQDLWDYCYGILHSDFPDIVNSGSIDANAEFSTSRVNSKYGF